VPPFPTKFTTQYAPFVRFTVRQVSSAGAVAEFIDSMAG
jgi:hypothetical protein